MTPFPHLQAHPMRRPLAAAFVVTSVFVLSNSPTPLYVQWQSSIGFASGTTTSIFAAYILALLLTLLVAGQLSDHFGRRVVLVPGVGAAITAAVLFATADNVTTLVVARVLTGIGVGAVVSAGMAAVVDSAGDTQRARAARLASIAMVVGAGLGPLVAGVAAQEMEHPVLVIFGIEIALLSAAVLVVVVIPSSHHPRDASPHRVGIRLPRVPPPFRRHVLVGIAIFGPGITATSFVLSLGPTLLAHQLGVKSPLVAGGTACAMFLVATIAQFAAAQASVRATFVGGAACTASSMTLLIAAVQTDQAALLIVAALLAGAGQGLGQLGGLTLIGIHVPATSRAQGNALMNIGGYIPAGLAPLLAGYLTDATSIPFAASIFGAILLSSAILGGIVAVRSTLLREPSSNADRDGRRRSTATAADTRTLPVRDCP